LENSTLSEPFLTRKSPVLQKSIFLERIKREHHFGTSRKDDQYQHDQIINSSFIGFS